MKRIKKGFLLILSLAVIMAMGAIYAGAEAVCTLDVSPKNAGIGEKINVRIEFTTDNMDIQTASATLEYDDSIIEVSEESEVKGSGGVISLSDVSADAPSIVFNVTFKAKAVGEGSIKIKNASAEKNSGEILVVEEQRADIKISENGGFVSDSKLKELSVSAGSLSKPFSPDVTKYEVVVENGVTEIEISAQMSSVKSYIYFSGFTNDNISFIEGSSPRIYVGKVQLNEGDNVKKITVEAENGEETVYEINIKRLPSGEIAPIVPDNNDGKETSGPDDIEEGGLNIFQTKPSTTVAKPQQNSPKNDNVISKFFPVIIVAVFVIAGGMFAVVLVARYLSLQQKKKKRRPAQRKVSEQKPQSTRVAVKRKPSGKQGPRRPK